MAPRATILLIVTAVCAGCVGLSELQASVSRLDEATHTAATAEAGFLAAVGAADCEDQFYKQAFAYSLSGAGGFSLAHYCNPTIIKPEEAASRKAMMDALVLYADKMAALASSASDKQLSDNSQKSALQLRRLAESGTFQLSAHSGGIVAGVTAAFAAVADLVLDKQRYRDVSAAATAMQPHIEVIVAALQTENAGFAQAIAAGDKVLEAQLRAEVASASGAANRFAALVQARQILIAASGTTLQSIGTVDWDTTDLAKPISDALPNIQRANAALAKGTPANVSSAAHDLIARATAARDVYSAITSGH
jgi:hypothetical protein